jgi:hypothetical protein
MAPRRNPPVPIAQGEWARAEAGGHLGKRSTSRLICIARSCHPSYTNHHRPMTNPTPEQIAKLPQWAQGYIRNIQRERETAIRELNEWTNSQTPSAFQIMEMSCTGEQAGPTTRMRFVQTRNMEVHHAGITLRISTMDDEAVKLQWTQWKRHSGDVAFIPESFGCARLITKENMK